MDQSLRLRFLFDKYLQRRCTLGELEEMIELLRNAGTEDALTEPMLEVWRHFQEHAPPFRVEWEKMYDNVMRSGENFPAPVSKNKRVILKNWQRAVIVFVLLGIGILGYLHYATPSKAIAEQTVAHTGTTLPKPDAARRQTIHLPDGSNVILNADSKLSYPSAFNGRTREVYLTGEGYFDIKHKTNQPFLVHAGKITTRVLGTAFDIRAYPSDESVEITVTRGRVQVLKENKNLGLVTANQQISFSNKTGQFAQKTVDSRLVIAWKPEEISFNDISMQDAATQIEQRFNTSVVFVNPSVKNCRVTATFSSDDMLDEILTVICGVSKSNYSISNNKIWIDGKGCAD